MTKYLIILTLMCSPLFASGIQTFTNPATQNQHVEIEKIVPLYKLDSGLYRVKDGDRTLYLYKDSTGVIIHSENNQCNGTNND